MATRNVVLMHEDNLLVEKLVGSGRYESLREVVRAGLRLVEERESEIDGTRVRLIAEAAQARARARVRSEAAIRDSAVAGRAAFLE